VPLSLPPAGPTWHTTTVQWDPTTRCVRYVFTSSTSLSSSPGCSGSAAGLAVIPLAARGGAAIISPAGRLAGDAALLSVPRLAFRSASCHGSDAGLSLPPVLPATAAASARLVLRGAVSHTQLGTMARSLADALFMHSTSPADGDATDTPHGIGRDAAAMLQLDDDGYGSMGSTSKIASPSSSSTWTLVTRPDAQLHAAIEIIVSDVSGTAVVTVRGATNQALAPYVAAVVALCPSGTNIVQDIVGTNGLIRGAAEAWLARLSAADSSGGSRVSTRVDSRSRDEAVAVLDALIAGKSII
jgi:hypothetical protein